MVEVLEKAELEKYTHAIEKGDFSFLENLSQEKMAALYAELNETCRTFEPQADFGCRSSGAGRGQR